MHYSNAGRERHTPADHRPGGLPVTFAPGSWCAIAVAHVTAERAQAAIASYETLIEKARTSAAQVRTASVLRSTNHRRVIAIVGLQGHHGFAHLTSAWDEHRLYDQHRAVAESASLALYEVKESAGNAFIEDTHDAYAFEQTTAEALRVAALIVPLTAFAGFRGALVFAGDTGGAAILYRFEHAAQIDAFRAGSAAREVLGAAGSSGDAEFAVHPVKSFVTS